MSKLILSGHSFGGMTSVKTAHEDSRVKLVATLDPWLFCYHEEIARGEFQLTVPNIAISSERYHPRCVEHFPSWDSIKNLLKHQKNRKVENILVRNTGHLHQCDLACLASLELVLSHGLVPQTTMNETYILFSQLMMDFMNRQGFESGYGDPKAVRQFVESMSKQWLQYDIKCE